MPEPGAFLGRGECVSAMDKDRFPGRLPAGGRSAPALMPCELPPGAPREFNMAKCAVIALLFISTIGPQSTTDRALPFDKNWQLSGAQTSIVKDGGREVLQVESGLAERRDVRFENGTIDFDVQVTRRRSFVYLYFRVASDGEREEIYLRPHKSSLPDALQYAPVWQDRSSWQLYHGPRGTAAVAFEPGTWMHVRLVVQGRHGAVFVNDMTKPAMLIPHFAREPEPGYIAFGSFVPAGVGGSAPSARFANVIVRHDAVSFDVKGAIADAAAQRPGAQSAGTVRAWSVSQAFVPKESEPPVYPDASVLGQFRRLETDPDGLLELHRYVKVPEKSSVTAAVARFRVVAGKAATSAFDLGFSDVVTVFVNGQPVFRGDASYSFDRPRREGLIGFDQARLYVPLRPGDNEIAVVVTDSFGGWGVMGRFVSPEGLTLVDTGS